MSDLGAGKRPASAARHNAGPQPAGHVVLGCRVPWSGLPTRLCSPGARRALCSVLLHRGCRRPPEPRPLQPPLRPRGPSVGPWGEGRLPCLQGLPGGPQLLAAHLSVHQAGWGAQPLCFARPGQCRPGPASMSTPQPGRMRRGGSPARSEDAQCTQGSAAAARTICCQLTAQGDGASDAQPVLCCPPEAAH